MEFVGSPLCQSLSSIRLFAVFREEPAPSLLSYWTQMRVCAFPRSTICTSVQRSDGVSVAMRERTKVAYIKPSICAVVTIGNIRHCLHTLWYIDNEIGERGVPSLLKWYLMRQVQRVSGAILVVFTCTKSWAACTTDLFCLQDAWF